MNGTTGDKIWSFTTGGAAMNDAAVTSDGVVIIPSDDGVLYALVHGLVLAC